MIKAKKVYFNIIVGSLLVALAYYFLFLPQDVVIGGVTGIAVIFNGIFCEKVISSSLLILSLNILFLLVGFLFFGVIEHFHKEKQYNTY